MSPLRLMHAGVKMRMAQVHIPVRENPGNRPDRVQNSICRGFGNSPLNTPADTSTG
jgi:hypothetical protein